MQENNIQNIEIKVQLVNKSNIDKFLNPELQSLYKFSGEYKKTVFLPQINFEQNTGLKNVLLVGTSFESQYKSRDPFNQACFYELGRTTQFALSSLVYNKLTILEAQEFETVSVSGFEDNLFLFLLGFNQASWTFNKYKTLSPAKPKSEIKVFEKGNAILEKVRIFDQGIALCRSAMEETPENFNPETAPKIILEQFETNPMVNIKIITKTELEKMGMNGILSVGKGSQFEPCLVHLTLKPKKEIKNRICLVGKGITYDTGGLDIKKNGMSDMKFDMAGAGTMLGIFKILSELSLQLENTKYESLQNTEVHFIAGFAENMIDAHSYRSADVITTYSGLTMEISNTDAEGRVTLADTLAYATMQDPNFIVEASTLTGAIITALGCGVAGIMSNDKDLETSLYNSFLNQKELSQTLNMPEVFRDSISKNTDIADLANLTTLGKDAGSLTAGLILTYFVDQNNFTSEKLKKELEQKNQTPKAYPFVHIDVAGSSQKLSKDPISAHRSSGHGIRSIIDWIFKVDV
jgi:leucyl aminopeptidase